MRSEEMEAEQWLRLVAPANGLDPRMTAAIVALSFHESRLTFALPANRPHAVTAGWGLFQWNQGAVDGVLVPAGYMEHMWGQNGVPATPEEEMLWTYSVYATIWEVVGRTFPNPYTRYLAIRAWHRGPRRLRNFLAAMRSGVDPETAFVLTAAPANFLPGYRSQYYRFGGVQ